MASPHAVINNRVTSNKIETALPLSYPGLHRELDSNPQHLAIYVLSTAYK